MAKHRTLAERKEALLRKLAILETKEAEETLKNNEVIKDLNERLSNLVCDNLKYQRWETEWESKVENFENRANEWRERGTVALDKMRLVRKQRQRLEEFKSDAISKLTDGLEVSIEDYSISNNMEEYSE